MAFELVGIVADRLARPRADILEIQAQLAFAGLWPDDIAKQAATLLLTVLMGATPATAIETARSVGRLVSAAGRTAIDFVAAMVRSLADLNDAVFPAPLAHCSVIVAELGDGPAVTCRFFCEDGEESLSFTDDRNGYRPDRDLTVGIALSLPGRLLFRIARDIAMLNPPIERRFTPGTVEVKQ